MHQYFHTSLGFCIYDLLALIVLAAMVVILVVHIHNQKKRQVALEQQVAEKKAQNVASQDT